MDRDEFRQTLQSLGYRFVRKCSTCGASRAASYYINETKKAQVKHYPKDNVALVWVFPSRFRITAIKNKIDVDKITSKEDVEAQIAERISALQS